MKVRLHPLGDNAIIIEFGEEITIDIHKKVQRVSSLLENHSAQWMIEFIPAFSTVTVFYDPLLVSSLTKQDRLPPYKWVCNELQRFLSSATIEETPAPRVVEIPVCYGGEFGPDLEFVAEHNGLTPEKVIDIHADGDYIVYMIGFAPGFPYLGGMPETIAAPRRESPRFKIPPRTVGIAGRQTGIYPIETPGGWRLIGRTPLPLFRPDQNIPSLLRAGDKIKFKPISLEEYKSLEEESQ
ncbi:5-oxoprolinase subunit PxpB [Peribacillus deserti]|uniref:Kinase inhibitor n=1 Tax=Peribacillus deserti TaxID=673318 RepID=A0A2N5M8S6_9BACI|nr:5-oxoprolinase subunit PxpB [Peribacillus deserti]PLT30756.1 kinase inhibitor [Peribacillus deserti]